MTESPPAPAPKLATPQQIVRRHMRRILVVLLAYLLTTLVVVGFIASIATGVVRPFGIVYVALVIRLTVFGCLMGAILFAFPRDQETPQSDLPLLELAGIWPMDWSPRKSILNTIHALMLVGAFLGWLIIEATLCSTESRAGRGFLVELANPAVLLGGDVLVFVLACLGAIWLWWSPQLQQDGRLQVSEQGLKLMGMIDRTFPAFVPWAEIKRAEMVGPSTKRLCLQLWHRPQRRVLALRLPPLAEQDVTELEALLEKHLDQEVPTTRDAPAPRQFHRLLERLGKRKSDEDGGLLEPEKRLSKVELSDAEFEKLLIEDGIPIPQAHSGPAAGDPADDALPLAEFATDPNEDLPNESA